MKRFTTKELVYMALLVSLSVVLTRVLSVRVAIGSVEGIRIGFGGLPIVLAGIAFGPLAGGLVGAVGDVVGYVINPMGAYMPHFTLTSALTGILPGLIVFYLFGRRRDYWVLLTAIAVGQAVSSVVLVPLFLESLFGIPRAATVLPRVVTQAIQVPIYASFVKAILAYSPIHVRSATKPV